MGFPDMSRTCSAGSYWNEVGRLAEYGYPSGLLTGWDVISKTATTPCRYWSMPWRVFWSFKHPTVPKKWCSRVSCTVCWVGISSFWRGTFNDEMCKIKNTVYKTNLHVSFCRCTQISKSTSILNLCWEKALFSSLTLPSHFHLGSPPKKNTRRDQNRFDPPVTRIFLFVTSSSARSWMINSNFRRVPVDKSLTPKIDVSKILRPSWRIKMKNTSRCWSNKG